MNFDDLNKTKKGINPNLKLATRTNNNEVIICTVEAEKDIGNRLELDPNDRL